MSGSNRPNGIYYNSANNNAKYVEVISFALCVCVFVSECRACLSKISHENRMILYHAKIKLWYIRFRDDVHGVGLFYFSWNFFHYGETSLKFFYQSKCISSPSISSVIVGAPRAQSTLSVQRSINETGAIYKCSLDQTDNEPCVPFVFDVWGNTMDSTDQFTYNNEKKDHQWLGAAMDGNANDGDKLVVSTSGFYYMYKWIRMIIQLFLRNS